MNRKKDSWTNIYSVMMKNSSHPINTAFESLNTVTSLVQHTFTDGNDIPKSSYMYSILFNFITLQGRLGFATTLSFWSCVQLPKWCWQSIHVSSFILSLHFFFCLPLPISSTVPRRLVFAKLKDLEMWPNHLSFHCLAMVRSLFNGWLADWLFLRTSLLGTWSLYEIFNILR